MLDFLERMFRKIPVSMRFLVWVGFAAISFLSFTHVNSYIADKHNINWLFWALGFIFAGLTVGVFIIANEENNKSRKI